MKRILLYFTLLAATFVACDPIEDRDTLSGSVDVKDLKLSHKYIVVDGKNTNDVIVENNSPILSRWISDRTQIEKAYGTVTFDFTGNKDVKFVGLNGDGSKVEAKVPVKIDTITNIRPDFIQRLGIKYKTDGTVDKTSIPYYFGKVADATVKSSITVVQEVKNGKKGNVLTLKNTSPVLSNWNWGGVEGEKNSDELFVTSLGDFNLTFKGTKADGSTVDFDLGKFTVDSLTKVPKEYIDLFGDFLGGVSSKTWEWSTDGPCWANGGYLSASGPASGWWQNSYANMLSDREVGTMEFKFNGYQLTKTVTGGAAGTVLGSTVGTVKIDLSKKLKNSDGSGANWSVGHMTTIGVNVLYGINVNDGNSPYYEYDILKITSKEFIVAGTKPGTGAGGESWFFKFQAKK